MTDREKVLNGLECCIDPLKARCPECPYYPCYDEDTTSEKLLADALVLLKEQEPDASKYQYKYDHTDCLWYHDSRSKCPVTCSQYRDGWNDAMDFIFKNGAGYSPYKRS